VIHPYGDTGDPFFARTADYSVSIDVEEGIGLVGTGRLTDVVASGERETWHFDAPDSRDAGFAAGSSLRGLERNVGTTTLRTWYNGEDTLAGARIADDATSALRYFSQAYGSLTTDEVDVVVLSNPLGGMEYPGLVYVSSGFSQLAGLPLLPELVEHSEFENEQERYITGHELAHQWWYSEVGNDQAEEPWLDEGFAEASTRLWLQAEQGNERAWQIAHLEREPSLDETGEIGRGVTAFEGDRAYTDAVYDAGGELLIELRARVGSDAYDELLRGWLQMKRGRIGTIDEFVDLAERTIGEEARLLLERYLGR
jgi:aminopeptidase N